MGTSAQEQVRVYNVIVELIGEFSPDELDYIEMSGERIVSALERGEDVRKTFNKRQMSGDLGADGHLAIEAIKSLGIAWNVYKMYRAVHGYLSKPAPIPASLHESFVLNFVAEGYSAEEAHKIANTALKTLSREFGG